MARGIFNELLQTFIVFNEKTRTADMFADVNFAAGEQVFETYGNKVLPRLHPTHRVPLVSALAPQSNYEYLLYNGFVMEKNPNECVNVVMPAPRQPNARELSFCLDPNAESTPMRKHTIPSPGDSPQNPQNHKIHTSR